jgi:DNA-binding response OmpR family regulator
VSSGQGLRVLVLDPDAMQGQQIAMTLESSGLDARGCAFEGRAMVDALHAFDPQLLWVRAELGSDALGKVLATLERQGTYASLPIVLLCQDVREAPFVRQMKTGVVELLQLPFSPRLHVARLRLLPRELPERSAQLRGKGTGRELSALFEHIIRTHRTGNLQLDEATSAEGRAVFVRGRLQNAWYGEQQSQAALVAMSNMTQGTWQFSEGADGAGGVFEWNAFGADDEPDMEAAVVVGTVIVGTALPDPGPTAPVRSRMTPRPMPAVQPPPAQTFRAPAPEELPDRPPRPTAPAPVSYPAASAAAGVEPAPDAPTTPVLFVDDDAALAKMFASYFSKKGYPVDTAADGVEAMQKLLRTPFEIVIADLNMPRLDGWGLLRVVREDARTQETPVALFSCHDDYRESLRAVHAGAQAYYPKTLRMNALELQVRELLEPRRRFARLVASGQSVTVNVSSVGAQWVLRLLARLRVTGRLDATDAWATFRLHFSGGQLVAATARVENQTLSPDQSLTAFVSGRGIEGSMAFGTAAVAPTFNGASTEELLARLTTHLNDTKKRAREESQAGAKALEVNPELYQLYASVGPPPWRPIAQLLCEMRLLPRDVMTQLNVSAQEVAAVVNDLILRGVASLKA